MSKSTTIMTRLSNQMKKVSDLLGVKTVGLNKVDPKYNRHSSDGRTKGVDSDHIKIYQLGVDRSFAFAFNYTKATPPYVMVSSKQGAKIVSSQYSEEAFRQKLNDFVKLLEILKGADNLNTKTAESTFSANFIKGQEYDPSAAVDSTLARIKDRVKEIKKKHVNKLEKKNELEHQFNENKKQIKSQVEALKVKENFKTIQKKYFDLVGKVESFEEKLNKDLNMKEEERKLWKAQSELHSYQTDLTSAIKEETASLPKQSRDLVEEKIEKLKLRQ